MATYQLISSVTVGSGGASSIDFTSIPATYTDLKVVLSIRGNVSAIDDYINLRFNSDSGSNYSNRIVSGNGTTPTSTSWSSQTYGYIFQIAGNTATSSTFSNIEIYIPNYTSSNQKSYSNDGVTETNATSFSNRGMALNAGLWSGTAAITSINLSVGSSTSWNQYSTAYLYGIKNS